MKLLFENWRKIVEGEVIDFPRQPKTSEANVQFVIFVENGIARRLNKIYGGEMQIPIEKLQALETITNEIEELLQE